jgi:hypothetical protein
MWNGSSISVTVLATSDSPGGWRTTFGTSPDNGDEVWLLPRQGPEPETSG